MELHLEKDLPHQQRAIDSVCDVFNFATFSPRTQFYENPQINLADSVLINNIKAIQDKNIIPADHRKSNESKDYLPLDVKMETGTGKTYVYTKTIFELNKRFGINKFIIIVPTRAIKAGTGQFINDEYSRRHFKDVCGYNTEIELAVLEAAGNGSSKQRYFPYAVSDFIKGSYQNTNKIYVLLLNMQLLSGSTKQLKDEYDYGAEGFYRPFDAIKATKPFVIIDEPHRFSKDQKTFTAIKNEISPQCIIRYGATFPEITTGKGKSKITTKDYQNLLYDLDACKSFNLGLIKGVAKEHLVTESGEKIKILSTENKDSVRLQIIKRNHPPKTKTVKKGESLGIINEAFSGITVQAVGKKEITFSNGETRTIGQEIDANVYMTSYQEQMLHLALERHFDTEKKNFSRTSKIKTLALFFIDDIFSYRKSEEGKKQYLLESFERLLKEEIQKTMNGLSSDESNYRSYLQASLDNISACHAGYFAQDNNDTDENIAKEVNVILNGKKELLSFTNPDGSYNTLRFLFSKWTLKEGWDNPNVFTITKLRSSGSEISKLQEVGRGLRLPVDENGNRIQNEEFELNYIVDLTEADFAKKLVEEINGELPQSQFITKEKIEETAKKLGKNSDELFAELLIKHYVDSDKKINSENRTKFFEEYPTFETGVSSTKIKDRNVEKTKEIKINKTAYSQLRELWEKINEKYYLFYHKEVNAELKKAVLNIFENGNIFTSDYIKSERENIKNINIGMEVQASTGKEYEIQQKISYGTFLSRITRATNIPMSLLHETLVYCAKKNIKIDENCFTAQSAINFCVQFQKWKADNLQGHFSYKKGNAKLKGTVLSYKDGSPRETITQGRIGTKITPGKPTDKYLYDTFAYDSPLEMENEQSEISDVIVYGKIPKRSIAIPTIADSSYSPDFMYVVKKNGKENELNIIVETKDVENESDLRDNEITKIKCAQVFFENLSKEGYKVHFRAQLNTKKMIQLIDEISKG